MIHLDQYNGIAINDMTPTVWRGMTKEQRDRWWGAQILRGKIASSCMMCDFPTHFGGAPCENCEQDSYARWKAEGEAKQSQNQEVG